MNALRQIIAVTALGFKSLHTRIKSSLVIVVGLTIVVAMVFAMLSFEEGLRRDYLASGDPNRAIILSSDAGPFQRERTSSLPVAAVDVIKDAPGIRKAAHGSALADAEVFTKISVTKKSQSPGTTNLRGIGPTGFAIRPELKLISGRMLQAGKRELIVGTAAKDEFAALETGSQVTLPNGERWPVVGVFSAGNLLDGDLIADCDTLKATLRRMNYSSVLVLLETPASFTIFKNALNGNPALKVMAQRESDYWAEFFESLPLSIIVLTYAVGFLMVMGLVAGTVQTMYTAVGSRENEIAILRALGFSGFAVAASVVLEAMLLACTGALIGLAIDWLCLNGTAFSFAFGVFRVAVTFHLLLLATGLALVVALIGAVSPAIHASRVTVIEALRAY
jgi:putative ABC transport system permease protein